MENATKTYDTIGGLYVALRECEDQEALVYVDNRQPTALSSYRGYYDQLAIERTDAEHSATEVDDPHPPFEMNMAGYSTYIPGTNEVRIKSPATVGEFAKALDLANGETFEGYKGGQFTMYTNTALWVSEYGQCDRLRITGMEVLPGRVDLVTSEVEW